MQCKRFPVFFLLISGILVSHGCSGDKKAVQQERTYRIEMVGPAQVVQLYADGFDQLSQNEKIFAYYLYLSSIAARDIAVDQSHRNALEVRDILEELYKHGSGVEPGVRDQITTYLKLF